MISRPWNTNVLKKMWVSPEMDIVERYTDIHIYIYFRQTLGYKPSFTGM